MNRLYTATMVVASLIAPHLSTAQLAFGGEPIGLRASRNGLPEAPEERLPAVDVDALLLEDAARVEAGYKGAYRFGFTHSTAFGLENSGIWHTRDNGDRVWRTELYCPGALGIGVIFGTYVIPTGGQVFLYNRAGERFGAYTAQSNPGHQVLGVQPIKGERVFVEYVEPAAVAGQGSLVITTVTHVYRSPGPGYERDFGDSGECNVNVICPDGDDWRAEIRSVACIIAGGGYCTGTLLNNCNNDSIPYFLTANHCLEGGTPPDTWVFRFNWDSPTCDPTENAPTDLTVSGSTQLANNAGSDMLFLQLSSRPPAEFDVTYSGWDANGLVPDSGTCIHHPAGDIKKISHDNNPQAQANIDVGSGPADCWHVFNWESGTTEPGSSGSALWDQNHRVVGQLYGGAANCNNNVDDYFGRLDVSYPFISEWLGECGSTDLLDPGYTEPVIMYDAAITSISGVPASVCNAGTVQPTVSVKNNGAAVLEIVSISYWIIGGASNIVPWTGSLQPLQTVNVQLPPIAVTTGPQTLVVGTLQPNGQLDQVADNNNDTLDFVANTPGEPLTLTLIPDDYGADITWTLANDNGTVLYQGGPYTDFNTTPIIREFCLGDDCYVFTINDAFGDGICCDEGNGSYTIQSAFFTQLDSDGNYGDGETREFCIDGVGVAEIADNAGARLWPNPTTGTVNVEWPGAESPVIQWSLLDLAGRLVDAGRVGGTAQSTILALADVPEGSYLIQLISGSQRTSLRLHIAR